MKKLRLASCIVLVLLLTILFAGCSNSEENITEGMYLVIYDGNGGYLGNKATTTRRLYCQPGSKLPSYPTDYTPNQYTVSSLGLANKAGYTLAGWYLSSDQDYYVMENGEYVYLSVDNGNGIITEDLNGTYVIDYQVSETGKYIFVYVETVESTNGEGDTAVDDSTVYIFLKAEIIDGEKTYVPGFYVYSEEVLNGLGSTARTAFEEAYAEKTYSYATVKEWSGWNKYADLEGDAQTLFAGFTRYSGSLREATDEDAGAIRYTLYSDYVSLDFIMEEDENGEYVSIGKQYVPYDKDDDTMTGKTRYSVSDRYRFTATEAVKSPSDLTRYGVTFHYWSFENDRVTADKVDENGRLILYAHWVKKTTVYYHYENGTGQVDEVTKRLDSSNKNYIELTPGDVIGKKEIIPTYAGHTFVGWSRSATEFIPWNFATDVFPEDQSSLDLYAYYVEGTYTRVVSKADLAKVASNPAGKYVLCADIDLGGQKYSNTSPTGLDAAKTFTGEFISHGFTISNFTVSAAATKTNTDNLIAALFPVTDGAVISGVNVDCTVSIGAGTTVAGVETVKLFGAGLVGKGNAATKISDCSVKVNFVLSGNFKSTITYTVMVGDVIATSGATVENCTAETNMADLEAAVAGKTIVLVKNELQ